MFTRRRLSQGSGSIGRAPVSKTGGCGFESRLPCCHVAKKVIESMSDPSNLNRQTRRFAKKQGLLDAEGEPKRTRPESHQAQRGPRTSPPQFFREVRKELDMVAWPSRDEVMNYSLVVLTLLVLFTGVVAAVDYGLGEAVTKLFER